ncbi:UPF0182 family membrane protein [Archaeoglobus sp.]
MNSKKIVALIVFTLADLIIFDVFVNVYTEYLWFKSLNYGQVFVEMLKYKLSTFLLAFSIIFVVLTLNAFTLKRAIMDFTGEKIRYFHEIDAIVSLIVAYGFSEDWLRLVFFVNSTNFNLKDPIFGYDVSFFVFKLPFVEVILQITAFAIFLCFVNSFVYYIYHFRWVRSWEEFKEVFPDLGYLHVSILFTISFFLIGVHLYVERFELLFSQHGVVSGASWVEVNVLMPALLLMSFVSFGFGLACLKIMGFEKIALLFGIYIIVVAFALGVIPFTVQKLKVEPNELQMEWNYINYSIHYTRFAFGLDKIKEFPYEVKYDLSYEKLEKHRGTIKNVRLWDHRPLLDVYRQLQQIRTYYFIKDVDVDRYYIDGNYTEVMISARELSTDLLPTRAKTWVNEHLVYTHGYGVIASPVNVVSREGLPDFIIKDIPPRGKVNVTESRIYYGELTNDYVVVKTKLKEFDYPMGDKNVFTTYDGTGGVKIDGIKKFLFAMRFGDVNLLLSHYITDESRIMIHRNITDRVKTIAPFLKYDSDPYVAVINGKIYWIIDAYTVLDRFPYSDVYDGTAYIRNPVKVFVDAYNGTVEFYIVQEDAVLKTLEKAFPIFKRDMPSDFRKHIRYPVNLFELQAKVYAIYHMTNVEVFYNREDAWGIPQEIFENGKIPMEPYYVILSIDDKPEFVLMIPFTPKGRENMIAWMCARCDKHYGEIIVYEFPKGKLVYGPMQIEARIDQNPEISKLFTLWGQVGSRVIRGNLLVIPIEGCILYIEPIYLKAEKSHIPELRGVIVSYNDYVVMRGTLEDSLKAILGKSVEKPEKVKSAKDLVRRALEYYNRAIESVKNGNWSAFGEFLNKLGETLRLLNESVK